MAMTYELGIFPDWWKLPAPTSDHWDAEWVAWSRVIDENDPHCRGVLLLGLAAPQNEVKASLKRASEQPLCKGFAVGRTIFGAAAEGWFSGAITDDEAKDMMATSFDDLIAAWRS